MNTNVTSIGDGQADFLSITDFDAGTLADFLNDALALKVANGTAAAGQLPLAGTAVALLFDKPSLRTRVSFEVGINRLGGITTTLSGADVGLGSREPIQDIGRTLARYVDAVVIRALSHDMLIDLAAAADVPVVNALTEWEHPCQALADLLTLRENLGQLAGRQLVYVGDGNNVCHSLLLGGAALGLHVRVAAPPGHGPHPAVVNAAAALAQASGARIELMTDPLAAVRGADAVYTDVWASMGSEHEAEERRLAFAPYRVDARLMSQAPDALVMHCLPAHRGEEISAEVLDGPASVAFDQAENRMYVQQAVLLHLLGQSQAVRGATFAGQLDLALAAAR